MKMFEVPTIAIEKLDITDVVSTSIGECIDDTCPNFVCPRND